MDPRGSTTARWGGRARPFRRCFSWRGCLLRVSSRAARLISSALESTPGSSLRPVWGEHGESPACRSYTTILSRRLTVNVHGLPLRGWGCDSHYVLGVLNQQPLSNHSDCFGVNIKAFSWRLCKRRGGQEVLQPPRRRLLGSTKSRACRLGSAAHSRGCAGAMVVEQPGLCHTQPMPRCWAAIGPVRAGFAKVRGGKRKRTFGFAATDTLLRGP